MTEQTKAEQETIYHITADNRETIHVFSDDPVQMRKIEKAGAVITRQLPSGGKEYEIQYRQLSIRKAGKRQMSEEQREAARERMKNMRGMKK